MNNTLLDSATIKSAVELALHAPSVHNSQPWLWRIGAGALHLHADPSRQLHSTDPSGREMYISCGIALQHTRIALASLGWSSDVHRLPSSDDPYHVASIRVRAQSPLEHAVALAAAIPLRRSDRRWYSSWPVPAAHLAALTRAAASEGVVVERAPMSAFFRRAAVTAAEAHSHDSHYQAELAAWSGDDCAVDGVPSANVPAAESPSPAHVPMPNRTFPTSGLGQTRHADPSDDAGTLLVFGTPGDDRASQIRAGEAAGNVLLEATMMGLATCTFTEPLELDDTRDLVRQRVSTTQCFPQLIVRTGWAPVGAEPVPPTPRRPLSAVLEGLDSEYATTGAE